MPLDQTANLKLVSSRHLMILMVVMVDGGDGDDEDDDDGDGDGVVMMVW